ncbi:MAG: ATP-binding cassette domain-containing protein [Treponema sp.]|nr:ATP-binding cassette domain-containing protein [Treponema sp.]
MNLLELREITYKYPLAESPALKNINLSIQEGEFITLLGANGSGKSTLARLIAGFFKPDTGSLVRKEGSVPGIVFQQPKDQIVASVVERDTAFGPQNLDMTPAEIELRTIECLSLTGLSDRASSRTFELSLGQTQRLAFSGILALFPDLLILDEVTAMLDPASREEIIKLVQIWNEKGHTVVQVTHDADEALRADRIIVMEKGSIIFDGPTESFVQNQQIVKKVFDDDSELYRKPLSQDDIEKKEVALTADRLSFSYPGRKIFKDLSFSLRKGTLTALTGPSGCGKSTLFECLSGLNCEYSGKIYAEDRPVLALQESEASLFATYAADDVAFGAKNRGLQGKDLLGRVKDSMEKAGLPFKDFADRHTFELSGGEKRKLSVAGLIALDSSIMIFDEPTAGLDPQSRKIMLSTLQGLAKKGKTVLFSTHRMEEADAADIHLDWLSLTAEKEPAAEVKEKDTSKDAQGRLTEMPPLKNASILLSLSKAGDALTAPPQIPPSPVSRLGASLKVALFALLGILSIIPCPLWASGILLLVCAVYAALAKYPAKKALSAIAKILPWFAFFAIIQFAFYSDGSGSKELFRWKWFTVTQVKLENLLKTFIRAPSIILLIGTFIFSTEEREILDGMTAILSPLAKIKIPVRYAVLVTGIIFRFIPLLLDEMRGIVKTQIIRGAFAKARGLGKLKILLPLFVPLILQTFRKAQNLADALTARYFS